MGAAIYFNRSAEEGDVSVLSQYKEVQTYASNTTITDSLTVNEGELLTMKNGAELTVQEETVINGAIGCQAGSMTLTFEKKVVLNDTIVCESGVDSDVIIVAKGGLVMGENARIISDGNVQIVDSESVIRSNAELNELYDAVETVPEGGLVVGPFVDEETELPEIKNEEAVSVKRSLFFERFVNVAHAQINNGTTTVNLSSDPIIVSGKIKIQGPVRKGAKRVVVFDFPNTSSVTVQNFELEGPAGRPGDADTGSCDVTGKKGEDAFRFNAFAPNLTVNNFTLMLGDGGKGGEATAGDGCEEAKAKGGDGGKPGNFRMIGSQKFEITGAFI
ncbi:hypothetical protein N8083_02030, partial [Candidatus Pacebacteria bacterium]|nr:hypothetical protein [Candidatus Paceibacterota bacterium]